MDVTASSAEATGLTAAAAAAIAPAQVLIIGHEEIGPSSLAQYLTDFGISVSECETTAAAEARFNLDALDLAIIRTALPNQNVSSFISRWSPGLGFLIVSPAPSVIDRVVALELGADDLVDADCDRREIVARLQRLLRRSPRKERIAEEPAVHGGTWTLNQRSRTLFSPAGRACELSQQGADLINALIDEPSGILTEELAAARLGSGAGAEFGSELLRVAVSRIRRRFKAAANENLPVKTLRGIGYALTEPVVRTLNS